MTSAQGRFYVLKLNVLLSLTMYDKSKTSFWTSISKYQEDSL